MNRVPLRWRVTAGLLLVWAASSLLIACTRFSPFHGATGVAPSSSSGGPRIDHAAHMDKGLECANCHIENAVPGDPKEPRAPTYAACKDCHDDEDAKKPEPQKVKNRFFRPDGTPAW